jgi:hypothetical protein
LRPRGDAARKAAEVECANVDLEPTADNLDEVRAAVLCLHNRDRAAAGLPTLKENAKQRKAAGGHSDDMVERRYFLARRADWGRHGRPHQARRLRPPGGCLVAGREHRLGHFGPGHRRRDPQGVDETPPGTARTSCAAPSRRSGSGSCSNNPSVSPAGAGATYTADFGVRR